MNKAQWTIAGSALLITISLYAITQNQLFGHHPKTNKTIAADNHDGQDHSALSIDTILKHARENLSPEQLTRTQFLETSITRGDVNIQKIHVFHQLARFWRDTVRIFEPFAWYTAEVARLENSEKSLTFAAHLFLDNMRNEQNHELKSWKALQAKDLFERSLKLNSKNDSAQIGLGATYLFGGFSENPMEGIQKIRNVIERDPGNIYAQMTLAEASLLSGQTDKAIERFLVVVKTDPDNLQAILSLADIYERNKQEVESVKWYRKSLPLIKIPELRKEVEVRINNLSK